ncbi:hypothetical protein EDB84DRAFT_1435353 [Lactarius hengduanensis]|nr:hypothetical protein EDB84DRAFT_1435353 [Lactarius hengduanensis]
MPPSPPSPPLVRRPYARMTSGRTKRRKLDWTFDPNDETGLILHKAGKCSLCDDWSAHFYDHHAANNPTLEAALQSRDRVLQAPLQPAVDGLRKEHDEGRQELAALRRELEESHTPRRRKYAHPPSPRRSEVPASPVVVAYSSSSSPPDFSSKCAVPDKPQTSRGKERRSNARDAVETDGARPGYNVNKRSQATQIAAQNMQLPATPGSSRDTGEMSYPCGIWPIPS